jgi:preprotein translocase subunit YajC
MAQYQNLIFIVALVAAFYFLLIRPQQKRQAQQKDMIASLSAGDEIVTIGGIFATVDEVGDRIKVHTLDGSKLEIARVAIGQVIPASDDEDDADDEDDVAEADEAAADDGLDGASDAEKQD